MYKNGAKGVSAKTCSGYPHGEVYFAEVFKQHNILQKESKTNTKGCYALKSKIIFSHFPLL